ncbi:DUF3923 family protein [Lacticaseibacillus casei]|uniref:DUF3923 family protein n=1 Tax=Lacticaseibacillus huelsenbergensis TaxID=3035291 RepID=A0ABY8DSZ8_9LACO|nr:MULTISPECIES: DUF3923 family protein [Lacticaseibacillus]MDG3062518.1 DUF3923 family protein [Lacticaseibacillus sp. BCRC 81376]QVI36612.1 DUF3923 family protein [Lacticaseibacillus casei]QXG58405.1 DUF3923 family protein [Lacticaseibacillus casei]WFB40129.1 DUF3923 family protein [Lacticaseibacillus huelsenbergensis]WFB41861.1 DUF3923 family protein [Lacticaseibacillus huelsenbergensis]
MKRKVLWLVNGILAIAIVGLTITVLVRQVDGTGHVETLQSRLASLAVIGVVILVIALVEGIYLFISNRHS